MALITIALGSNPTLPYTLAAGNDLLMLAGASVVHGGGGAAIRSLSDSQTLTINGSVFSASSGVSLGGTDPSGGVLVVGESGRITGASDYGVDVDQRQTEITNYGAISGAVGIYFRSTFDTTQTLVNSGAIIGLYDGVYASDRLILTNIGTIMCVNSRIGDSSACAVETSSASDRVTNRGLISGHVDLGGGNDTYEGNGGRVNGGWIWGNSGHDKLHGGAIYDLIYGGVGNDTITGRGGRDDLWGDDTATLAANAGNDTFDFNVISESGTTASTRDVIRDFNNGDDRIDLSTIDANKTVGGNQAFTVLAKGTATSAVDTGKIGWYWIDAAGTANDRTIIRINNDADSAADMTIELVGLKNLSRTAGVDFVL